jgi:hypothetical protein
MQTSKERLEIIAHNIKEIDLSNYTAIYAIGNLANELISVIEIVGKELFPDSAKEAK